MPNFKMQVIVSYLATVTVEAPSEQEAELLVVNNPERYLNDTKKISSSVETFDTTPTTEPATPVVPSVDQTLIDAVLGGIEKDVMTGDVTALEIMLASLTKETFASLDAYTILQSYLSE